MNQTLLMFYRPGINNDLEESIILKVIEGLKARGRMGSMIVYSHKVECLEGSRQTILALLYSDSSVQCDELSQVCRDVTLNEHVPIHAEFIMCKRAALDTYAPATESGFKWQQRGVSSAAA